VDFATDEKELSYRAKIPPEPMKEILTELLAEDKVIRLSSKLLIHRDTNRDVQQKLLDIISDFHRSKPESPGLSTEQLYEASKLNKNVLDGLVELLVSQGRLAVRKNRLALPDHRETFSDDEQELLHTIESLFKMRLFNPPKFDEVIQYASTDPNRVQKTLRILIEQELLIRVDKDMLFHREAVEEARQRLVSYIKEHGGLESVKFKYLLDTTRKFAIPLLDYFDRIGVTRRVGYTRHLKTV
jgi:selenocysteine-specific elongation factor